MKTCKMICIVLIIFVFSTSILGNAKFNKIENNTINYNNEQFYLGYVNIWGNGSSSNLEAIAENDFLIKIKNQSEYVDFYIDYDIECNGLADQGSITLIVSINGQNTTPKTVISFTKKNGSLTIENINVQRRDAIVFYIQVIYTSPLHANSTSASGAGVVPKTFSSNFNIKTLLFDRFEKILILFQNIFMKFNIIFKNQ